VVGIDLTTVSHKVVLPCLESMDNSGKLEVMSRVIQLMRAQLTGQVGNNLAVLHKDTSKTKLGCIALDVKALGNVGHGQDRS
jgi:hypothetical protein